MTSLEAFLARRLAADLKAILGRGSMALGQLEDVRDRVHRHDRDVAALEQGAEALLLHHFRTCHDCVTGPGCCPDACEIAEFAVQRNVA